MILIKNLNMYYVSKPNTNICKRTLIRTFSVFSLFIGKSFKMDLHSLLLQFEKDDIVQATLSGELESGKDFILWSYQIYETGEECSCNYEDEDEMYFGFERPCNEELLFEAYRDDFEEIKDFLVDLGEENEWKFSDPEVVENLISFKIY